jgi:hypothetical protein
MVQRIGDQCGIVKVDASITIDLKVRHTLGFHRIAVRDRVSPS